MGLRFQRRVTLIPGVRLNFSASGISASFGPRGAGINLSSRGTTTHVGIPGTGLSYRSFASSSSSSRGSASKVARWERQQAKEAERQLAREAHDSHQRVLNSLNDILRHRVTEPIDWAAEYAPLPPFVPEPFEPPSLEPTAASAAAAVNHVNPLWPWLLAILGGVAAAAIAPQWWLQALLFAAALYYASRLAAVMKRRGPAAIQLLPLQAESYRKSLSEARSAYDAAQEAARQAHDEIDATHARLRSIETTEDVELAASVLEVELSNEDIPVPIHFDVHFEGLRKVTLRIDLPAYGDIPEIKTAITKTGLLSQRPMAIRDRAALYRNVCAGITLRLVYETYRVLPFVKSVNAEGLAERPVHRTNEPRYRGLAVGTTRDDFGGYDLDGAEPGDILAALGGRLSSNRDGSLEALGDDA